MLWAQWTLLILIGIGFLWSANRHGKPKEGDNNFWVDLAAGAITVTLYYCAGAFSHIFR